MSSLTGRIVCLAALGLAMAASGVARANAAIPASGRFALDAVPATLLSGARLRDERSVLQSFAFEEGDGQVYLMQVEGANDAGTHAEHDARGDLVLTRLTLPGGTVTGHMVLRGFGHGVAMGVEREGEAVYLWTEVDAEPASRNSSRGARLGRFRFADGVTLEATSAVIEKFAPLEGQRVCTPSLDLWTGRIAMRYVSITGAWRAALFDLAALKAGPAKPLADIALPVAFGTVQGWCTFGSYLYVYSGEAYGPTNPPPGNATLWCIDWNTGAVVESRHTTALSDLPFREPEGLAVQTGRHGPRLCFGFGAAVSARDARRRASIAYLDDWRPGPPPISAPR
jgi:hypothetical protein